MEKQKLKFLVWFTDRVYELENMFASYVDMEYYVDKLPPRILAKVFEIRNARLKMESIYGKVPSMKGCLEDLDSALLNVERFVWEKHRDSFSRDICWHSLDICTRELTDIWSREYGSEEGTQAKLEVAIQPPAPFCLYT